jgi:hypothetical protein
VLGRAILGLVSPRPMRFDAARVLLVGGSDRQGGHSVIGLRKMSGRRRAFAGGPQQET